MNALPFPITMTAPIYPIDYSIIIRPTANLLKKVVLFTGANPDLEGMAMAALWKPAEKKEKAHKVEMAKAAANYQMNWTAEDHAFFA